MPMPATTHAAVNMMFENFSPIDSWIMVKFSPIWDGNYSTFYFSKYATSYFIMALRYLDLRLNVMFSAICCQNA